MKKFLLLLLTAIFVTNAYAQIIFEKGYYVNNSDEKVDCLIKNMDWKDNPTEFSYKLRETSDKEKATIETVKEFGIYNGSKYLRSKVKIDRSSESILDLSEVRNPIFIEEVLFLTVLIESKASLYEYIDGNLVRYFYSKDNSAIEQLIYKSYKSSQMDISRNNKYKQQLWNDLKCSTITMNKVENVKYKKKSLVRFFVKYNECNNETFINFGKKPKRDLFNLNIRPSFNRSSLLIQNNISSNRNVDFGNKLGFRFGVEAELIAPFNKNKWAFLIEPTYQSFKSELEATPRNSKVEYQSIELLVGLRHYFFLSKRSKIFLNSSFVFDLSRNSFVEVSSGADLNIATRNNLAVGLGYKYNDKFSVEARYQTNRELLGGYVYWSSDYNTASIIFGYSIF